MSYLSEDGLQWWKLLNINKDINITTFEDFNEEILKYFEPVNREVNARKALSALKQMGNYSQISAYNAKFSKWLLQVPSMTEDNRLFHYNQGLKHRIRVEMERSEIDLVAEAMRTADRMDNIYGGATFNFHRTNSGVPEPIEIGNVPIKRKFVKLSPEEKNKPEEENKCFVCQKVGCFAKRHNKRNSRNSKKLVEP